jgi:hypothetical protein
LFEVYLVWKQGFGFEKEKGKKKEERNPNHRSSPACFPLQPSAGPPQMRAARRR